MVDPFCRHVSSVREAGGTLEWYCRNCDWRAPVVGTPPPKQGAAESTPGAEPTGVLSPFGPALPS
jgi:hypothetical protein